MSILALLLSTLLFLNPAFAAAPVPAPLSLAPSNESLAFTDFAAEYWATQMRMDPLWATFLNYPGYNDRLEDNSAQGYERQEKTWKEMLARLKTIDRAKLPAQDQVSFDVLKWTLQRQIDWFSFHFNEWEVDHMNGFQVSIPDTISIAQPMATEKDAQILLKRLAAVSSYVDNAIVHLKKGLKQGVVASEIPVNKTLRQIDEMLKLSAADSPYVAAVDRMPLADKVRKAWRKKIAKAVNKQVNPAYARYGDFLKKEILPKARGEDNPGLFYLPNGKDAYRYKILYHTTLDKTADELHEMGWKELRGIQAEMRVIANRMRFKGELKDFMEKVRTDPNNLFKTRGEMMGMAQTLVDKIKTKLPQYFGRLPKTDLIVKEVEPFKEKNEAAARYYQPSEDLSRPGIYYLNTYKPETRQKFTMTSLAAHEGVPGHHLQIALAMENKNLPAFRRNGGSTAFVEGWALYTERLIDEMGLYENDLSRLGMLSDQAWRACRLVVDTGLHAKGWSRAQAMDFMKANTMMTPEEVETEVDRYIIWPGQALAYMVGKQEIMALRTVLKAREGARFDIRAFHDSVLQNGAVPLAVLRQVMLGQ